MPDDETEERSGENRELSAWRKNVDADDQHADRQRDHQHQPRRDVIKLNPRRLLEEVIADGGHQQDEECSQGLKNHVYLPVVGVRIIQLAETDCQMPQIVASCQLRVAREMGRFLPLATRDRFTRNFPVSSYPAPVISGP